MEPSVDTLCYDIIMEYLVHSCYKNTAKAFQNEYKKQTHFNTIANDTPDAIDAMEVDSVETVSTNGNLSLKDERSWQLLDARKDLYDAIERGDIPQAFSLIQQRFPGLLEDNNMVVDGNSSNNTNSSSSPASATKQVHVNGNGNITSKKNGHSNSLSFSLSSSSPPSSSSSVATTTKDMERIGRVLFKLRCQQFIEIVRSSTELEAIMYAQQYMRPLHEKYEDLITEVASLIAYTDPEQSNQAHLLSQDRRRHLADEVNCVILEYCDMPKQTAMERLQQQYQLVEQELQSVKKMEDKTSMRDKLSM